MKPKYMLDTNICIYLMIHQPPEVAARFEECFVGDVVISVITMAELEYGIVCSGANLAMNRQKLNSFVEDVPVTPFDVVAAHTYALVRVAHKARTKDALDKLIAAHAIALGATLVTNNEADFVGFSGLMVENWVRSH